MKRFYFSILLLFVTNTYYSQWSTNPNENLQVAVHGGNIHAVPDGKGGAILTFNNFDYDVVTTYLQSVDRYGYLKWTEPKIIADGPGPKNYGVGLFSSDDDKYIFGYISGYTYIDSNLIQYAFFDPYIQKIDTNGNKLWGEYGIKLNPNSPSQRVNMFMCNDGNGGIYAFWKISPPPDYSDYDSLFLQHISKAGEKLWGENGIFIGDSIADNYSFWIVNDDSGGVYVQYRKKDTVYCIEKFDSLGTLIWSLITSARFQEVIKDEHSGIIVSGVYFSYPTDKIVINRISSTGVKLWGGGGGIIVDDSVNNSSSALLLLNSDNTISVFWDTNWWPNDDLFLQRFTLDGEQMWEEHLIVTDVVSAKERAGIVESENNSNIVIWSDSRPPGGLFAQQINEFGENVWADSDRVIMYRNVLPDENGIITDGDYGVIVVGQADPPWGPVLAQQISKNGNLGEVITSVKEEENIKTMDYYLAQNYPNPFNPSTTIKYVLPEKNFVSLKVYDILGREVKILVNEIKEAGTYSIEFNASKLSSGIYLYTLTSGNFVATKKLILLK